MDDKRIVLVTGAGKRGNLGHEVARQLGEDGYKVILAARREDELSSLTEELVGEGMDAEYVVLDVTDESSVAAAANEIERKHGRIDALVNNAALLRAGETVERQDMAELSQVFETNVIGAWSVTQKFLPLLRKSSHPRIVNVSSGAGSFGDPVFGLVADDPRYPTIGYGISKLAMNGFTVKLAKEVAAEGILVNSVCPDLTDTAGVGFGRPVPESAKSVTWAVKLPDDGPTGGFFRDGEPLPW